jgi:hypothetical protein
VLNRAYQQNQSPFFQCLPAELRLIIYAFVFRSQSVHIILYDKGGHNDNTRGLPTPARGRLPRLMGLLRKLEPKDVSYNPHATRRHGANISGTCRYQQLAIGGLVRACRLLYVESVPLLYTNTTFAFSCTHCLNAFCKAISVNRQHAPPPLMFVRDIRVCASCWDLQDARDANVGLTLLTEQAVNLKGFELAVQDVHMRNQDYRAHIWCGGRADLLIETLRILGRFRGLESFDLYLTLSAFFGHVLSNNKMSRIAKILRELVFQPKGSGAMTARKFHNHFKIRYQALKAQRPKSKGPRKGSRRTKGMSYANMGNHLP